MTLLFMEGFDHIDDSVNTLSYVGKWSTWDTRAVFSTGRWGTGYACAPYGAVHTISPTITTMILGFAYKRGGTTELEIFRARNASTALEYSLTWLASGILRFTGGTTWDSTWVGDSSSWYYIEVRCLSGNGTSGSFDVRVDGTTVITQTGVDTSNQNGVVVGSIIFPASAVPLIDDLYLLDGVDASTPQGAANNDFLGPVRIATLYPDAAGNYSQWTPSAGSNYQNVDDPGYPNDDTDYNTSGSSDIKDTFSVDTLPSNIYDIKAIQYNLRARKTDVGSRSIRPLTRISSIDYGGTDQNLSSTYSYFLEILGKNPNTGVPWEISDIGSAEFGYESRTI
jgi:hypothetical protein